MDNKTVSLIALARAGDENAYNDLAAAYKPLIESMGKNYAVKCNSVLLTEDDFIQEANLGFFSAVRTYEPSDKVTFGLYAKICIRNRLVSLLRNASKKEKKRKDTPEHGKGYAEPVYGFLERENAEEIQKKIEAVLSRFELSVFSLYVQNKSYKEIAEALGRSVKTVDNALYRIKTKLKTLRGN